MNMNVCYKACNDFYTLSQPQFRLYCKKGCDADDDTEGMEDCKKNFCNGLCIK